MRLILDTVSGHELVSGAEDGQCIRMGMIIADKLELPKFVSDATILRRALSLPNIPNIGDPLDAGDYKHFVVRRYILRAVTALHYSIAIVYKWLGPLRIRDSASLSSVQTSLFPNGFIPIYVIWKDPNNAKNIIKKIANFNSVLPVRHLVFSQTVNYEANVNVIDAFGGVNDQVWQGKPKGYWMYTGIDGETLDNGKTYTYTATFTTKQREDWSQMDYMTDERGQPVFINPDKLSKLRKKEYFYGIENDFSGIVKVGLYQPYDFKSIFGV